MKTFLSLIVISLLLSVGCNQSDKAPQNEEYISGESKSEETGFPVVARVNGEPVTTNDVERTGSIDRAIMDEILFQEGIKEGFDKVHERRLNAYLKRLVVNDVKEQALKNAGPRKEITEDQVKEYYDENADAFSVIYIKEIMVDDKTIADEILQKAKKGEKFEDIAKDYAESDTLVSVNNLGPGMEYAGLFNRPLKKDEVSNRVLRNRDNTYSVFQIAEIKLKPYEIVRSSIKSKLEAVGSDYALREYVDKLIEKDNIKIERTVND